MGFLAVFVSFFVGLSLVVPLTLIQRYQYRDNWPLALAKSLCIAILTAIPTALPSVLTIAWGVAGMAAGNRSPRAVSRPQHHRHAQLNPGGPRGSSLRRGLPFHQAKISDRPLAQRMSVMPKAPSSFQQDPDNMATAAQFRPDVTRRFDTVAGELAGVADRSGAWVKEQVHSGLQDFVSRVLYDQPATQQPDKDKQPERDPDKDMER